MPTCSSGWRRWCGRPKPRPARGLRSSGDPENSVLDDVSHHLLRSTLGGSSQTLVGKTHPLFAIAWLGHALLATILGAFPRPPAPSARQVHRDEIRRGPRGECPGRFGPTP